MISVTAIFLTSPTMIESAPRCERM